MTSRLEALADSIANLNDYSNPESEAYQLRNPGLLRAFTIRHAADEMGRRIFPCSVDGYQALLFDLTKKCLGESRSKLKPDDPVSSLLLKGFSQPLSAEEYVLCFLQRALPKSNITARTPVKFFVEGKV
jgi:hypothetical protein